MTTAAALSSPDNAALAVSAGAAMFYWTKIRSPPSVGRMAVKTAATALLAAAASLRGGSQHLVGALALGAAGDAFLSWDGDAAFLGGLTSFLVGHTLYMFEFAHAHAAGFNGIRLLDGGREIAALVLAGLVAIMMLVLPPRVATGLGVPVFIYAVAIFFMDLTALATNNNQVMAGALMFTGSDALLAVDRFLVAPASPHRSWMQKAVWFLYYTGQLLMAVGALSMAPEVLRQ
ncbi:YhhN-like protein-domain-containing protein [Lasiosphaeria ovina]|uniref:YhhN-like protein-domain-containing protein n=1 Tax=Lasiosphaeria ovina TaxID=92902 RepID=A0AAE0KAX0_9PEZI|nr:YhhN-like protein-domain-containing protein [Lasiosphaeria ovina]